MVQINMKKLKQKEKKFMLIFSIWEYRKLLITDYRDIDGIRKEGHSPTLMRK